MLTYHPGNILNSECHALINTVNCRGAMGAGLALQFKERYEGTDLVARYQHQCRTGALKPGMIYPWQSPDRHLILNCATKDDWRNDSKLEWIDEILIRLVRNYERLNIRSIACPPMGCGLGSLDWNVVGPRITSILATLPIPTEMYGVWDKTHYEVVPEMRNRAHELLAFLNERKPS